MQNGSGITIRELAKRHNVKRQYIHKIIQQLVKDNRITPIKNEVPIGPGYYYTISDTDVSVIEAILNGTSARPQTRRG